MMMMMMMKATRMIIIIMISTFNITLVVMEGGSDGDSND